MMGLLAAMGMILVLIGATTLVFGLVRHFFPMVDTYIPDDFKPFLTTKVAAYCLLAGLLLLLIQPAPRTS